MTRTLTKFPHVTMVIIHISFKKSTLLSLKVLRHSRNVIKDSIGFDEDLVPDPTSTEMFGKEVLSSYL